MIHTLFVQRIGRATSAKPLYSSAASDGYKGQGLIPEFRRQPQRGLERESGEVDDGVHGACGRGPASGASGRLPDARLAEPTLLGLEAEVQGVRAAFEIAVIEPRPGNDAGGGSAHQGLRRHDQHGSAVLFHQASEAVPEGSRDAAQFVGGVQLQVQDHQVDVAVAQQQVGGLEGLGGASAPHPEQVGQGLRFEGVDVEAVGPIDQGQESPDRGGVPQQGVDKLGAAGTLSRGDQFGEGSPGQSTAQTLVDGVQAGGQGLRGCP